MPILYKTFVLLDYSRLIRPYELVYLYYAYKAEFATVPAANRKIAPSCRHQRPAARLPPTDARVIIEQATVADSIAEGVPNICTFYDFYRYIGSQGWKDAMGQKDWAAVENPSSIEDPLTRTINPDADRIAVAINDIATIGDARLATLPARLWSRDVRALMGAVGGAGWANQLRLASKVIEEARPVMATRELDAPNDPALRAIAVEFERWVGKAADCLSAVHSFRSGDFSRFFVPAQKAHPSWTSSPMSDFGWIDTPSYTRIDGSPSFLIRNQGPNQIIEYTYQVVNWQDSFDLARGLGSPLTEVQKQDLFQFSITYGTVARTPEKAHKDILDVVKAARDLHRKGLRLDGPGNFAGCLL